MPASPVTRWLGWAGVLPFVAGAVLCWLLDDAHRTFAGQALVAYAAVIASFLGGVHWGRPPQAATDGARAWGVMPSLLAWPLTLLPSLGVALLCSAAVLALCWAVDRVRYPALGLSALLPLRNGLSGCAVASCATGALAFLR